MRLLLYLKAHLLRLAGSFNVVLDRWMFKPGPPRPALTLRMQTRRARRQGTLTLYVYTPASYRRPKAGSAPSHRHPLVVNFHGGGFTIGHATDDGRLAGAVVGATDAVFVSVGYRKGPRHAAPTAALDAADALEWLWAHADELGVDPHRTVTTGSSAGGNLSLAAPLLVHEAAAASAGAGSDADAKAVRWGTAGALAGVVALYPSVDQTIAREAKAASNPASVAHGSISPAMYKLFDDSYYTPAMPPAARSGVAMSPGLASDDATLRGLPDRLALYTCEWDQLLAETDAFRAKLTRLGKSVGGFMVDKAPHAFDKDIRVRSKFAADVDGMYADAAAEVGRMVGSN